LIGPRRSLPCADGIIPEAQRMNPVSRTHGPILGVLLLLLALANPGVSLAVADGTKVPLPTGVSLAVVVFEDLQCPDCARAHPQLLAVTAERGVPLLIHDFPITRHAWAFPAAILARHFAAQSPELGREFRSYMFAHQKDITPATLRAVAEQFAQSQGATLPADVDPQGQLQAAVQADFDLGRAIGLEYVPLVFVSTRAADGSIHAAEVTDVTQLGSAIDAARASSK
jgi:protein-disulfide isomerase